MGHEKTTRRAAERFSRPPSDRSIRLCAALTDEDEIFLAALSFDGFIAERATVGELSQRAAARGAEVLLLDADLPGAIDAITRLRQAESVLSTLPVVLFGSAGLASGMLRGADAFLPKPVDVGELATRLRTLVELPAHGELNARPSILPAPMLPSPEVLRPAPSISTEARPAERPAPDPPSSAEPGVRQDEPSGSSGLSRGLSEVLRAALQRSGGDGDVVLPSLEDEAVDELIPPELLEPLDAPPDVLGEGPTPAVSGSAGWGPPHASRRSSPSLFPTGVYAPRSPGALPTVQTLAIQGEPRLSGAAGPLGAGPLLGAAARSRTTGTLSLRTTGHGRDGLDRAEEFQLFLSAGHVLALTSTRSGDQMGPLLARLGAIPREAVRFARAPLEAGPRAAASLVAQGYLASHELGSALGLATRELVFDLLTLPSFTWEIRPLEAPAEAPLSVRALDALLVLGARARVEPDEAFDALGGEEARLSLTPEVGPAKLPPLAAAEESALEQLCARAGVGAGALRGHVGASVFPALLALVWIGALRVEGPSASLSSPEPAIADERARVRSLLESAERGDLFALLGVSEWTTRAAALDALETRSAEVSALASRHRHADFRPVHERLSELRELLSARATWDRYVRALRGW
jgi:hypothetical protein